MRNPSPVVAVLDDEPEMRKALRRLLTCRQLRVEEYHSAEQLLAALISHSPDCLLLDLQMPEMNGFALLENFQSRHLHLPVIVITAHDEPDTAQRVKALGAFAYLKKPVDGSALFDAIQAALDSTLKS